MKLLFVFTGGTIGSTVSGDYITTDENKPYELIETCRRRYGLAHSYDVVLPYTELSEQNTGVTISKLVECVREAVSSGAEDGSVCNNGLAGLSGAQDGYDGIIVTHGTDTLPYSAAALSYALGIAPIPVCVVSSNYPISDERANGVDNLYGAIRLIEERRHRGVFVPYRNHDGIIYIHRAARLLESMAFSDEYFSVRGQYYGIIRDGEFQGNENYREREDLMAPFERVSLAETCGGILRIRPYPGMVYPSLQNAACILHESYHSGTINTKLSDYQAFFDEAYRREIPVFLTGVSRGISYESTSLYEQLHIIPSYDISPVAAYMKLWMADAGKAHTGQFAKELLKTPLGGDL